MFLSMTVVFSLYFEYNFLQFPDSTHFTLFTSRWILPQLTIHPFSVTYLAHICGGNRLNRVGKMCVAPATSSSGFSGIPLCSQAIHWILSLQHVLALPWGLSWIFHLDLPKISILSITVVFVWSHESIVKFSYSWATCATVSYNRMSWLTVLLTLMGFRRCKNNHQSPYLAL